MLIRVDLKFFVIFNQFIIFLYLIGWKLSYIIFLFMIMFFLSYHDNCFLSPKEKQTSKASFKYHMGPCVP